MSIYHPGYSADDLLALWTVSGGVARYVDMMVSAKALTRKRMLNGIFSQGSSYLSEGKTILAEEFGTDYGIYFRFWFRFVFKYRNFMELERYEQMREIAARDFDVFSGYALERYFQWKFVEDTTYTRMGAWWNRKGEDEIDLVCEDELSGRLDFFEVKRNPTRFDAEKLKGKVAAFFRKHPDKETFLHEIRGLSMEEM